MIEVRRTAEFIDWLTALRDGLARARIAKRIDRLARGNFGDAKSVGDGVSQLRFTLGPGYRVYYTQRGDVVVILLCGGDKGSQASDIARAKAISQAIGRRRFDDGSRNQALGCRGGAEHPGRHCRLSRHLS